MFYRCVSVHRGGHAWWGGGMHGGGDMFGGGRAWQGGMHGRGGGMRGVANTMGYGQ